MAQDKAGKNKTILEEFGEFIRRGNVMDLAVGVIIGGAFTTVVSALVNNVIQPLISFLTGGSTSVSGLAISLNGNIIDFGAFVSAIINFLLTAAAVFAIVKALNKFNELKDIAVEKAKSPSKSSRAAAPTATRQSTTELLAARTAPLGSKATQTLPSSLPATVRRLAQPKLVRTSVT